MAGGRGDKHALGGAERVLQEHLTTVNAPNRQVGRSPAEEVELPKVLAKVVNPLLKALLHSPLHGRSASSPCYLAWKAARPVGDTKWWSDRHEVNGKLLVPLETTGRRWQLNLRGGTPVEITAGGRLRRGRGELVEDPEEVARVHEVPLGRVVLKNARRLGLRANVGAGLPRTS